jgi:hypothetical protein
MLICHCRPIEFIKYVRCEDVFAIYPSSDDIQTTVGVAIGAPAIGGVIPTDKWEQTQQFTKNPKYISFYAAFFSKRVNRFLANSGGFWSNPLMACLRARVIFPCCRALSAAVSARCHRLVSGARLITGRLRRL